jgi:hypothetical protein
VIVRRIALGILATALMAALMSGSGPVSVGDAVAAKGKVRIPCLNSDGTKYVARFKPAQCAHLGRDGAFAGGVDLRTLQWSDWGRKVAHGTGVECGFRADCGAPCRGVYPQPCIAPCPPGQVCAQQCPVQSQAQPPVCNLGIPVTVEAFRKRSRCGRRIYTRLRATSEFGTSLVKTKACLGRE